MEQEPSTTKSPEWIGPKTDEASVTPGISILLYICGFLFIAAGAFKTIAGMSDRNEIEIGIGASGVISGLLFIGLAFGLTKLNQIEVHLRKR